jgi:hypothetical protein
MKSLVRLCSGIPSLNNDMLSCRKQRVTLISCLNQASAEASLCRSSDTTSRTVYALIVVPR